MDSEAYSLIREAIVNRREEIRTKASLGKPVRITGTYDDYWREFCPIALGHSGYEEMALMHQVGGESSSSPYGWKCIKLVKLFDVGLVGGEWEEPPATLGKQHSTCIRQVEISVGDWPIPIE